MGDRTTPNPVHTDGNAHNAGGSGFTRSPTRIATDCLLNRGIIGNAKMRGPCTVRYVHIDSSAIFESLVNIYHTIFKAKWRSLQPIVAAHQTGTVDPKTYLARVYLSHWFNDLYASIREACFRHENVEVTDFYGREMSTFSNVYDTFLAALLQSIKPTHIKGHHEDTLYIPLLCVNYEWNDRNRNYFRITNYTANGQLARAVISKMKDPSTGWHVMTPSNDPLGRPCWLFDWHNEKAYAWFPEEENYNMDDVNLAYIIGVACTPTLTARDIDAPQQYPDNIIDEEMNPKKLERRIPPRFSGNITVRAYDTQVFRIPRDVQVTTVVQVDAPLAIGATGQGEAQATEGAMVATQSRTEEVRETREFHFTVNCFRVIDYVYYACVIRKVEMNVRSAAHRILTFKE